MPPRKATSRTSPTVAPSETPQRMTRARSKTPLPAIAPQGSHAYGAPGKANLAQQMRQQTDDFSAAFEENRTPDARAAAPAFGGSRTGGTEPDDEGSERAPSQAPQPRRRHYSGRPPVIPEEPPELELPRAPSPAQPDPTVAGRQATALDHDAHYGGVFSNLRAGMRRQFTNPNSLLYAMLLFWTVLGMGFVAGILSLFVPAPAAINAARENFTLGMRVAFQHAPYDQPMEALERTWFQYKHDRLFAEKFPGHNLPDLQFAININVYDRLEKVEKRVATIEQAMALDRETLAEMQRMLPQQVLVQIVDGKPEIPTDFWTALQYRIAENTDVAPQWQAWVLGNDERIAEHLRQYTDTALDNRVAKGQLIQREDFVKVLDEKNDELVALFKDEVRAFWEQQMPVVKDVATRVANEALENIPDYAFIRGQIETLLRFNHVQNMYQALHTTNWFALGLGARIDPHLTSATKSSGAKNWMAGIYRKINPLQVPPNPPIIALYKWDEATECWCGTPDQHNNINLGILTDRFYPETLIIEHITPDATRNIDAAPREFEVWMEYESKSKAKAARKDMESLVNYEGDKCGESPGSTWACVLKGQYDIHDDNHIQSFRLWPNTKAQETSTMRTLFRATSNWGANYTCIYRVRMTGDAAKEPAPATRWFSGWV